MVKGQQVAIWNWVHDHPGHCPGDKSREKQLDYIISNKKPRTSFYFPSSWVGT